jgi:hypothetical protein
MSALPPTDAAKFGKIIGLLASDFDGERSAAALKATEFLRARQMSWGNVAEAMISVPAVRAEPPRAQAYPRPQRTSRRQHQLDASFCLVLVGLWKPHERQFLEQMDAQRSVPSEKQLAWLDGLHDRAARFHRENTHAER